MQTNLSNTAFAPLSPAAQMAADATDHMTEAERLSFAISLVNQACQTASIPTLRRVSTVALAAMRDIELDRMADKLSPTSPIDPVFWRVFLSFYNRAEHPTIANAYRHACLLVAHEKITCKTASEQAVRFALTDFHCANRTYKDDERAN